MDKVDATPGWWCSYCKHHWSDRCYDVYDLEDFPSNNPNEPPKDMSIKDVKPCIDFWFFETWT